MNQAEKLVSQFKDQPKPDPTLAQYIAAYIEEEQNRNPSLDIQNYMVDSYMIQNAIDAYNGGAR